MLSFESQDEEQMEMDDLLLKVQKSMSSLWLDVQLHLQKMLWNHQKASQAPTKCYSNAVAWTMLQN